MESNKRLDIELMRILAAYFVIFNHTGNTGFFLFSQYDSHSIQYWIYLFISVFCKFSVPLFFMIAGSLMLNRKPEPIKRLWFHRIFHIFCILVIWSFAYYIVELKRGNETFNLFHFFSRLYDSNWNGSYWYLYAYLSFLISLPLLQRIAKSLLDKEYSYILLLYIVFVMCIPSIQYLLFQGRHSLNGNVSVGWLTSNIVIYPFIGYFLTYRLHNFWNKKKLLILWLVNIGTILLSSYLTYYRAKIMGVCDEGSSQAFHMTFVLVNCVAVFATCQYLNEHSKLSRVKKIITSCGGCTLGIYLLHIFLKDYISWNFWPIFQGKVYISPMIDVLLFCVSVFLCGYVITAVLKRIPLLRKLVS